MSELKAKHVVDVYDDYAEHPCEDYSQVYLKSEADAVIADKDAKILALDAEIFKQKHHAKLFFDERNYAETQLRRQKYKRCLLRSVIAEMNATHFKDLFYGTGSEALADEYNKQITIHYKWQKRWLALAEKFKDGDKCRG